MNSLVLASGVSAAGAAVAVAGVLASMWASRRRPTRRQSRPGSDVGLVVAVVGGIGLIAGLGDLAFLLLTASG